MESLQKLQLETELSTLLKEAYGIIRERERGKLVQVCIETWRLYNSNHSMMVIDFYFSRIDLMLAAKIGKDLYENNIALKSKYESVVVQLQQLQRARLETKTLTIDQVGDKNAIPMVSPNNSIETFVWESTELEVSDTESLQEWSGSFDLQIRRIKDLEKENETLLYKVQELEEQNNLAETAKLQTTSELEAIKEEYVNLEKRFEMLLINNYEKDNLIAELGKSLEEQGVNYRTSIGLQEPPLVNFISKIFETSLEGFKLMFETSLEGFRKQLGV